MNRFFLSAAALLLLTCPMLAQRPVAFRVDRIHAGNGVVHEPGIMIVQGGKIVAVGSDIEIPGNAPVMDWRGCEITAGLIDAASDMVSSSATEGVSEVIPHMQVADAIDVGNERFLKLAEEGVTTIFATASTTSVVGCQGAVMKTGKTGRLVADGGHPKLTLNHDPSSGNRGPSRRGAVTLYTRRPTSQMGVVFVGRAALMRTADMILRGEKIEKGSAEDVLAEVLMGKRPIRIDADHQYEIAAGLRIAAEFGLEPIFEGAVEAWRIKDQLAATKTPVVMGPIRKRSSASGASSPFRRRRSPAKARGAAPRVLADAGVTFALTSGSLDGEYGLARQCGEARRWGLDLEKTLASVTTVPAKLLGMEDRIGRVAKGFDADFVVWKGEPFANDSAIVGVFVDGKAVKNERRR